MFSSAPQSHQKQPSGSTDLLARQAVARRASIKSREERVSYEALIQSGQPHKTETYYAIDNQGTKHQVNVYATYGTSAVEGTESGSVSTVIHKMQNGNDVDVDATGVYLTEVATGRKMRRLDF